LVVGAAGDVGRGIVSAAVASGRRVVAAGRDGTKLEQIFARVGREMLACVTGNISTEAGARALWDEAFRAFGGIEDVVVSVSAPSRFRALLDWSADELSIALSDNLLVHFIAARTFLPLMSSTGTLVGIGGGTADFIMPKLGYVSMVQAALRMMYRALASEWRGGTRIRELMIVSMVNGESNRARAKPEWITDLDVGRHVVAILNEPDKFPGPVLHLKSREPVGRLE